MGFKDLFIVSGKPQESVKQEVVKFPDSKPRFPQEEVAPNPNTGWSPQKTADTVSCEPYMDNVMKVYEKGFDSLNKEG